MSEAADRARHIEDASMELAMAASGRDRANRPWWMIVLAALVVCIAGVYLLITVVGRASTVAEAQRETRAVASLEASFDQLQELLDQGVVPAGGRDARAVSKLQNIAALAGLEGVQVTENRSITREGMQLVEYSARVTSDQPQDMLEWLSWSMQSDQLLDMYSEHADEWTVVPFVQQAGDAAAALVNQVIEGLELRSIKLKPATGTAGGWSLDVTFGRWERA